MYCHKCGKQIPDESSFCPSCGVKVVVAEGYSSQENSMSSLTQNDTTQIERPSNKRFMLILGIAVLFVLTVAIGMLSNSKITANNVKISQIYNENLGVGLKINMSKNEVDKLLGVPVISGGDFLYTETYVYTQYRNGKLASMYIEYPNDRWITSKGITIDTSTDDLTTLLGDPVSIEQDGKWWYYTSSNIVTGFNVSHEKVIAIYIYDREKLN